MVGDRGIYAAGNPKYLKVGRLISLRLSRYGH